MIVVHLIWYVINPCVDLLFPFGGINSSRVNLRSYNNRIGPTISIKYFMKNGYCEGRNESEK